jgi:tetratricopeptide (TPR) repeat protein
VLSYSPLYELLRANQRWAEGAEVCRKWLSHARELVRRGGTRIDYGLSLARANQCLGQMLDRTGKAADAEAHLTEAVTLREQIRLAQSEKQELTAELEAETGRCYYALAQHYFAFLGRPEKAPAPIARSIELLELACKSEPNTVSFQIELGESYLLAGIIFRQERNLISAEEHFDRAIAVSEKVLAKGQRPDARRTWVAAMTERAHLYNATNRHRDAAVQWEKLAREDPDKSAQPKHALFVLQSKAFAGDWREVSEGIDKLLVNDPPAWLVVDGAKLWCMVGRLAGEDTKLSEADRRKEREKAYENAIRCLERAKKAGGFKDDGPLKYFESNPEFEPVRGKFKPRD